jgi:predicted SAM-dependent methyltransferase
MEKVKNCPICGHTKRKEVFKGPYFRGNQELFSVKACASCGFWFTSPRPKEGEELNKYYATEDYVSHTEQSSSLIDKVYLAVRKKALRDKLKILNQQQPGKGEHLDYGAGTGAFVETAQKNGWQSKGVEPSTVARQQAEKKKVTLFEPSDEKHFAKNNSYAGITLWHVLEHLPNLNARMGDFYKWLQPNGSLIIAVPNRESLDAQKYGAQWAALDLPLHFYHFSKKDMASLAKKHGFAVTQISNMPFDSFYVSILSEKIKGKNNLAAAFATGLRSNWLGAKAKNMSSLIYVLTKV